MKKLFIPLLLIALAGGAMLMVTRSSRTEWTTSSSEALREFELGLAADMKYYPSDALEHYSRAVELDPDFAAARLYLSFHEEAWEQRDSLQQDLRHADLSKATARERFLLDFHVAQWDRQKQRARAIAEEYLDEHPEDPYGAAALAELVWTEQDWEEAEYLYRLILEIDPNWVTAQNRLGYIALARGRFEEAEELFDTYHYIAPDQANPHDSMGELLVLLGRYDEARAQFELALEIRPDFCNTYQHLVDAVLMEGKPALGEGILERAAEHCPPHMISTLRCSLVIWGDFVQGDSERIWSDEREECRQQLGDFHFLVHRTAANSGRLRIARRTERALKMRIEEAEKAHQVRLDFPRALLNHMVGTRQLAEENYTAAAEAFAEADETLLYWGEGQGVLKLYNQMNLAWAQDKLGLEKESELTMARVRSVNPAFASLYPHALGIE